MCQNCNRVCIQILWACSKHKSYVDVNKDSKSHTQLFISQAIVFRDETVRNGVPKPDHIEE